MNIQKPVVICMMVAICSVNMAMHASSDSPVDISQTGMYKRMKMMGADENLLDFHTKLKGQITAAQDMSFVDKKVALLRSEDTLSFLRLSEHKGLPFKEWLQALWKTYRTYLRLKLEVEWPQDPSEEELRALRATYEKNKKAFEDTPEVMADALCRWCMEAFEMEGDVTPNQRVAYLMMNMVRGCPQHIEFLSSVAQHISICFDCIVQDTEVERDSYIEALYGKEYVLLCEDIPAFVERFGDNWHAMGDELTQRVIRTTLRMIEVQEKPEIMGRLMEEITKKKAREVAEAGKEAGRIVFPGK